MKEKPSKKFLQLLEMADIVGGLKIKKLEADHRQHQQQYGGDGIKIAFDDRFMRTVCRGVIHRLGRRR